VVEQEIPRVSPQLPMRRSEKIDRLGSMTTMTTIVLLTISNIFMTFAWYGHLK
jgi:hypothetical protein